MNHEGKWRLAPAYDLVFSHGPGGEQSMTVLGEAKNPTISHLLVLAKKFDIQQAQSIINAVIESIQQWPHFAEKAGVSSSSATKINKTLKKLG